MTVSTQTPYNISTANGVTTSFACDFVVLESGDLQVRVDGIVKTYTTHYTITNLGGPSNAIVVFVSAPANLAVVERERIVPLTRSTDYQQSGDYLSETLNDDFDRLWMALQGLSFDDGYALHLDKADGEGVDMELPAPTATYFLRVNDDATGFEWYDIGDATLQIPADQSVTASKMYASATDVLFGRSSSGAGSGQEVTCTAAGRALLDDANAAAQRATLGLGTAAVGSDSQLVPTGAVMDFAMNTPPTGWLECDGAAVSRTTYAALFAAVGTAWGVGDGSTTFNLPDFRGEFRRGWDHGRGVDSGRAFASAQADELEAHTHTTGIVGAITIQLGGAYPVVTAGDTGSTGGSETRPRNIAVLTCIKT